MAKDAARQPDVNKLSRLAIPSLCVMTKMLANKAGDVFVKSMSITVCRHLSKLGNINAMHGLYSVCNDPVDQVTVAT